MADSILKALSEAVTFFKEKNIPLNKTWGKLHYVVRNGEVIPIHGGGFGAGNFSAMRASLEEGKGFTEMIHGNSYIQTVSWENDKVIAEGILTYSQSTDPANPHYADQTKLYSKKEWVKLPFYEEDILNNPDLKIIHLK